MKKLIIEIDLESADIDWMDVQQFEHEAKHDSSVLGLEIGRPIDGDDGDNGVARTYTLGTEYFTVRVE